MTRTTRRRARLAASLTGAALAAALAVPAPASAWGDPSGDVGDGVAAVQRLAARAAAQQQAARLPAPPPAVPAGTTARTGGTTSAPATKPVTRTSGGGVGTRADSGATVVAETRVDARTLDLTISSPALRTSAKVRLLLPPSWSSSPARRYPQLWLLHGANEPEDYRSWTTFTDVEQLLAGAEVLAVLPSDGSAGMYSDPWNLGFGGGPDYETFHLTELPQILDRGYRANDVRAVAGLSIGGFGAFKYAAKYPGFFRAAASYSGLLDTRRFGASAFVSTVRLRGGTTSYLLWGSELFQADIWRANNPYDLAPKLRGIPLYVSSGNGRTGPLDRPGTLDLVIEPAAEGGSKAFVTKARGLGLDVTASFYGGGTHSWPYWDRELKASWPMLAKALGVPA